MDHKEVRRQYRGSKGKEEVGIQGESEGIGDQGESEGIEDQGESGSLGIQGGGGVSVNC